MGSDQGDESDNLEKTEDSQGRHVLGCEEGKEADEGNLHRGESTNGVEGGIGDVEPRGVSTHKEEDEDMKGEHVGDERVSTYSAKPSVK